MNRKFKRAVLILNIFFCNITNAFSVTFDQLNASLHYKCFKKKIRGWVHPSLCISGIFSAVLWHV